MLSAPVELVNVRLLGVPVDLYRETSEHHDELQREFALLQHGSSLDSTDVPRRFIRLADELNARLGGFGDEPRAALAAAVEEGARSIDIDYRIPPHAREAAISLGDLLDEADQFCRSGEQLLTLTTPPGPLAFRRWFLGQFVAQIDGAEPTPWSQWQGDDRRR